MTAAMILLYNFVFKGIKSEEEYTASANELIFAGDNSAAAEECAKGLRKYPKSAELYLLKSRAYLLEGDTSKAVGTLDQGYKQTQNTELLERRKEIADAPIDDVDFFPLETQEVTPQTSDTVSETSDTASTEPEAERYVSEKPITVSIPEVTPPPEPSESEVSTSETEQSEPISTDSQSASETVSEPEPETSSEPESETVSEPTSKPTFSFQLQQRR